jgi:8-oxo-dGTP pyrophosphatase MutT (NUDIX family)
MGEGEPRGRTVFSGQLLSVEVRAGRRREIVHHPGSCAAVAMVGGDVLLVRQFRDAVGESLLEIPAGTRDVEGEPTSECAAREVLEETGHRVTEIEPLASVYMSPGFLDERVDLFIAQVEATATGPPEQEIEVLRMPIGDATAAVRDGRIRDAKSAVAILLAGLEPSRSPGPDLDASSGPAAPSSGTL